MGQKRHDGGCMAMLKQVGVIVAGHLQPIDGFKEGLQELGWTEGNNISFELRAAEGALDRLPELASEIVRLNVDVIAVIGAVTVRAVRKVTSTIPIIFSIVVEPVGDDMASNLDHPGGNVTGVTTFDPDQAAIQIGFLRDAIPDFECVAILSDLGVSECMSRSNKEAALKLSLKTEVIRVKGPSPDYSEVFRTIEREGVQALVILEEPINVSRRKEIAGLALAHSLPTVFAREQADAGGLFAYGTSLREAAHAMAPYVDKILNGTDAGSLPIRGVHKHELVVNLRTAHSLGVTVPEALINAALVIQ
jgi:putative tryptophan/tyrosine transport system substrate-binding protein